MSGVSVGEGWKTDFILPFLSSFMGIYKYYSSFPMIHTLHWLVGMYKGINEYAGKWNKTVRL